MLACMSTKFKKNKNYFNECQKIPDIQFGDPTIQTKMTIEHN